MRILFIGDVVSSAGTDFLAKKLPGFKKLNEIDFCIVNGENSAPGNGITPESAANLFLYGADAITTGNHALRRKEIFPLLDAENSCILRPQNLHPACPGRGSLVLEKKGMRLGVGNIMGSVYLDGTSNPFDCFDAMIKNWETDGVKCTLVDFHAETTSEKRAMGFYAAGRTGALLGTHTHVQTSDACILDGGTAYITDAGMTGVINSVLGVKTENILNKLHYGLPEKFTAAEGDCFMNCCVIELDNKTGRALSIESFSIQ